MTEHSEQADPAATAAAARATRLAAIEARLNPPREEEISPAPTAQTTASASVSSSSGSRNGAGTGWKRPSASEELEKKRELARTLQRSIVRDSGYAQAVDCVETLVKIANNIQNNEDPKFRKLKVDNPVLRNKVYSAPGGREFLILMGFHSETHDHVQYFVLGDTERHRYKLDLAAAVLSESLPDLQSRVKGTTTSNASHKAEEARRVALAKKQFEDDRNAVKDRTERERLARLARAQVEAKMAEDAAALEEQEQRVEEVDDGIWGDGQKLGS